MPAERLFHDVGLRLPSISAAQAEEWMQGVVARVHRGFCAMRGHDLLLHFEPRRLSLRCADCGWESPGWTLGTPKLKPVRVEPRGVRQGVRSRGELNRVRPDGDGWKPASRRFSPQLTGDGVQRGR